MEQVVRKLEKDGDPLIGVAKTLTRKEDEDGK